MIVCRTALPEDVAWLTDTFVTVLRTAITEARGFWDEQKERDQFLQQLRLLDTQLILLQGSPVGFFTAWMESDHLFLGTLCVVDECQSRGIGTEAMHFIAKQAGGLPVRFSVLKSNQAARRFYERLGCRHVSSSRYHDHFEWAAAP